MKKVDWTEYDDIMLEYFLRFPCKDLFDDFEAIKQEFFNLGLEFGPLKDHTLIPEFEEALRHSFEIIMEIHKNEERGVTHRHKTNTAITFVNQLKLYREKLQEFRTYKGKIADVLINDALNRSLEVEEAFNMIHQAWTVETNITHREQKWLTRLYWFPFRQTWNENFGRYSFADSYEKFYKRVLKIYKERPRALCTLCGENVAAYSMNYPADDIHGKLCVPCYEKLDVILGFKHSLSNLKYLFQNANLTETTNTEAES